MRTLTEQPTDTDQTAALREHLRLHGIGADERWDVATLQALHDLAHKGQAGTMQATCV